SGARFSSGRAPRSAAPLFVDLKRAPQSVLVQTTSATDRALRRGAPARWEDGDVVVSLTVTETGVRMRLSSSSTAVRRVRVRWAERLDSNRLVLGDAWERGYGDLEWRGFVPD